MYPSVVVNARFLTQPITGTQRYAIEICRALKKIRPDIVLLSPNNIIHQDIADELEVKVVGKIKKGILWEQLELPLILKRYGNPLLLNLCNLAPLLYSNNIVTVLDLSFKIHPEWFSKAFSFLYNTFVPPVTKSAKRVVTISEYSKQDIIKYFFIPRSKIDVVYPSVSDIFVNHKYLPEIKNKYDKYILAVSSIDPRKNFKGLIEAYNLGTFKSSNIKLLIVGAKHKVFADDSLKRLVADDPNILFTGYVDDYELVSLYKNALVFAYPSFFEGFGIPPLEAMACGCPTLVSDNTSLPEVCDDASVYVNPHDTRSILDGLNAIISSDIHRNKLIEKGYTQINKFNWNISAKTLNKTISEVLDEGN